MKTKEKQSVGVDCVYRSDFTCQFRVTVTRDGRTISESLNISAKPGEALGRIKDFCDRHGIDVLVLMHKLARAVDEPEMSVTGGAV